MFDVVPLVICSLSKKPQLCPVVWTVLESCVRYRENLAFGIESRLCVFAVPINLQESTTPNLSSVREIPRVL